ncbi:SDR family oxidoreductase [Sphingomonas sp. LM7]|uniref:SDR family oxidoreductase n=1 Tax=Sphingomonas sp. LM7 TaxID=1938607 RepID=UPI001C0D6C96|nr:SDR family oxidoreductase [Sphingomonas sp. LM7]
MSRILVIGGYGGFGARLTRRLLAAGHQVLVAGRSGDKAAAFCAGLPGAEPAVADRDSGIGMVLARERPELVIDAAGPFQASGYTVPEACIAMRISYLDLADGRAFVVGIGRLDAAAKAAGVPVVAGASSVPALSGAVVRALAGEDAVRQVEIAISASNRAVAGRSVAAAILSYVGKPIVLWLGRRRHLATGWQELRRECFAIAGEKPLRRWVALADVPDADLLPAAIEGRPATIFRAGTELGFQMIALWLLSWPVRWGWIGTLRGAAGWLHPLQHLTGWAGSDRSAMSVTVTLAGLERRWTLIAREGDGPEIPTLAAALLAEEILAGRVAPGARDAGGLLTLAQFEPLFARLAIRHAITERKSIPLYQRAMGARFRALPEQVREMHRLHGDGGARGEGTVIRGKGVAQLIGRIMDFPPSGTWPLHVSFAERCGRERWNRDFGGHRFSSELSQARAGVVERFGPLRFEFDLPSDSAGLRMVLRRWSAFGVPMPRLLGPRIAAREWQEDDRFRFEVDVRLPLVGPVVRYAGWLEPA